MTPTSLVELTGVSKTFHSMLGPNTVLDEVDLTIYPGEKVSLRGASGSGKSTLLSLIIGLLIPDTGTVKLNGLDLRDLNDIEQSRLRATSVGIALQSENLISFLTARENVELALSFGGHDRDIANEALALLDRMGVAHLATFFPRQISGGESQRVSLAVALANHPKLLIADEMVAQLDAKTANFVVEDVFNADMAVIFVTHNLSLADKAERRLIVRDKKIATL